MKIILRDVTAEDRDFLRQVYATTRADELAMVPWSPEQKEAFVDFQFNAQDVFYRERFPGAQFSVITEDGNPVGRIYILRDPDEIRMLDITVLPEHRGKGIGTFLTRELMAEGERDGKSVQIYVESFNRSRTLFERLGFVPVREEGVNLLFEWTSSGNSPVD